MTDGFLGAYLEQPYSFHPINAPTALQPNQNDHKQCPPNYSRITDHIESGTESCYSQYSREHGLGQMQNAHLLQPAPSTLIPDVLRHTTQNSFFQVAQERSPQVNAAFDFVQTQQRRVPNPDSSALIAHLNSQTTYEFDEPRSPPIGCGPRVGPLASTAGLPSPPDASHLVADTDQLSTGLLLCKEFRFDDSKSAMSLERDKIHGPIPGYSSTSPQHFAVPSLTPYTEPRPSTPDQTLTRFRTMSGFGRPSVEESPSSVILYQISSLEQQSPYPSEESDAAAPDPYFPLDENIYSVDRHSKYITPWSHHSCIKDLYCEGQPITPRLHTINTKGLELCSTGWFAYRRNFFSVMCYYDLQPLPNHKPLHVEMEGIIKPVQAIGMRLKVVGEGVTQTSSSRATRGRGIAEKGKLEIVQLTTRREKGRSFKSNAVKAAPIDHTTARLLSSATDNSEDRMRYPIPSVGPSLPLQHLPDAEYLLYENTKNPSDVRMPDSDGAGPTSAVRRFHHLQFGRATRNNGQRKPSQEYFRVVLELVVDIRDDAASPETWIPVAQLMSQRLEVRGRSPNNFNNNPLAKPLNLPLVDSTRPENLRFKEPKRRGFRPLEGTKHQGFRYGEKHEDNDKITKSRADASFYTRMNRNHRQDVSVTTRSNRRYTSKTSFTMRETHHEHHDQSPTTVEVPGAIGFLSQPDTRQLSHQADGYAYPTPQANAYPMPGALLCDDENAHHAQDVYLSPPQPEQQHYLPSLAESLGYSLEYGQHSHLGTVNTNARLPSPSFLLATRADTSLSGNIGQIHQR